MATCKYCQQPMQWARVEDRWIPLVPFGEEGGLERAFQDEDGNLRSAHRLVCVHGGSAVQAVRLPRPIPASSLAGTWSEPDADGVVERIPVMGPASDQAGDEA